MLNLDKENITHLNNIANELRITSLEMINRRGAGHPGGSLSAAEIISALYFNKMNIDPKNPKMKNRDRFILSKGHASAILYAALAKKGFFPEEDLEDWGSLSCHLQGHPCRKRTPGVDLSTGVLGHGVSIGAGIALGARLNEQDFNTYVLLGDGECQGGIVWEGFMTAAKYKLNKLKVIIDYNNVQLDGCVDEIMPMEPFKDKLEAFNFNVFEVDGHNIEEFLNALNKSDKIHDKPTAILARTIKGCGVSFMENQYQWHGQPPNQEEFKEAEEELLQRGV